MSAYKILLADEQEIFRQRIRNIIGEIKDTQICGEVNNGQELLELLDKEKPNLIIMEIDLPILEGWKVFNEVKKNYPKIKCLILTNHMERDFISSTLYYGVDGVIFKYEPSTELLRAVNTIRNGGKFFSPLFSAKLDLLRQKH